MYSHRPLPVRVIRRHVVLTQAVDDEDEDVRYLTGARRQRLDQIDLDGIDSHLAWDVGVALEQVVEHPIGPGGSGRDDVVMTLNDGSFPA